MKRKGQLSQNINSDSHRLIAALHLPLHEGRRKSQPPALFSSISLHHVTKLSKEVFFGGPMHSIMQCRLTRCLSMFLSARHRLQLSLSHLHHLCLCLTLLPFPSRQLCLRQASRVIIMLGLHREPGDSTKERQTMQKTDNPQFVANTLWANRYERLTIFCEHAVAVTYPESDASKGKGEEKMMTSHEIEMPAYNIRIRIPHGADDDSGDDDMEEDDAKEVPDRDQVKKYSSLMLEKANKKQKRQRKRKTGEGGGGGGTKGSKSGGKRPDMA